MGREKNFCLIIRCVNSHNQMSLMTINGEDYSALNFLERCFQVVENEQTDLGLKIKIDEPDDFGCAGGFCSGKEMWEFFENMIEKPEILANFGW